MGDERTGGENFKFTEFCERKEPGELGAPGVESGAEEMCEEVRGGVREGDTDGEERQEEGAHLGGEGDMFKGGVTGEDNCGRGSARTASAGGGGEGGESMGGGSKGGEPSAGRSGRGEVTMVKDGRSGNERLAWAAPRR